MTSSGSGLGTWIRGLMSEYGDSTYGVFLGMGSEIGHAAVIGVSRSICTFREGTYVLRSLRNG